MNVWFFFVDLAALFAFLAWCPRFTEIKIYALVAETLTAVVVFWIIFF